MSIVGGLEVTSEYGLVKVSTGIMKLEKRVVCNALNGKLKIKR